MRETVYRVVSLLCALVVSVPIGANLGPSEPTVRRPWAALGRGSWTSAELLGQWQRVVEREARWQAHEHEGHRPVAVDVTGFWRPRLRERPTSHSDSRAGKASPAIVAGIVVRVGTVGEQRPGLPLALVRADAAEPSVEAHERAPVRQAVALAEPGDVLVTDRRFGARLLQEEGTTVYVARLVKNFTARWAEPPAYSGRGRPATRVQVMRPLARSHRGQEVAATPPDGVETWQEGETVVRAELWEGLVLPDAAPDSPTFRVVAIHDPRHREALLLASPLLVSSRALRGLYAERWPVEQLPLAAKQMIGAGRQFVPEPETCQKLSESGLLAGSVPTCTAATAPAVPTGFWDRRPQPTPGRLRRVLAQVRFPSHFPFPARTREKAAVTTHLPKVHWGQRRHPNPKLVAAGGLNQPPEAVKAA